MKIATDHLGRTEIVGDGEFSPSPPTAPMSQYVNLRKDLMKKLALTAKNDPSGKAMNELVQTVHKEPMYAAFALVEMSGDDSDNRQEKLPSKKNVDGSEAVLLRQEMSEMMKTLIKKNKVPNNEKSVGILKSAIGSMEKSPGFAEAIYKLAVNFGPGIVSDIFQISAIAWKKHGRFLKESIGRHIGDGTLS